MTKDQRPKTKGRSLALCPSSFVFRQQSRDREVIIMPSDILDEKQTKLNILPPGPVTFEDFLAWCDEDIHAEWVDGAIIMMSPSKLTVAL
jgi:hypothetical protein